MNTNCRNLKTKEPHLLSEQHPGKDTNTRNSIIKTLSLVLIPALVGVLLITQYSCKKDKDDPSIPDPVDNVELPTIITAEVYDIIPNIAFCGGDVTDEGGAKVTRRGLSYATHPNPTIDDDWTITGGGSGSFTSRLRNLTANTTYYVRAYATNSKGTAYGNERQFTTPVYFTLGDGMTDADGNNYPTIIINNQEWMSENLRVTKLSTGTPLQNVTDSINWIGLTTPAYCWYNNDFATYGSVYGALYNWYAVETTYLCPDGWRVGSDTNWLDLEEYLGDYIVAGGKLKQAGFTHWESPNTGGTNSSGFNALPGSEAFPPANRSIGLYGFWWSYTWAADEKAWSRSLEHNRERITRTTSEKQRGFSVRCMRVL